jgi:N-acetylglutamate synthase-like GNAT family acetyltransferase
MKIKISKAQIEDFDLIKKYIAKFELDNRDLRMEQFTVAKQNDSLLGFARIRSHNGCDEFCSLGVIEQKRHNGIAKLLTLNGIKISTQALYLVTIIPEFFETLGYKEVNSYPTELQDKLDYCNSELSVPEKYVVMKYQKE